MADAKFNLITQHMWIKFVWKLVCTTTLSIFLNNMIEKWLHERFMYASSMSHGYVMHEECILHAGIMDEEHIGRKFQKNCTFLPQNSLQNNLAAELQFNMFHSRSTICFVTHSYKITQQLNLTTITTTTSTYN